MCLPEIDRHLRLELVRCIPVPVRHDDLVSRVHRGPSADRALEAGVLSDVDHLGQHHVARAGSDRLAGREAVPLRLVSHLPLHVPSGVRELGREQSRRRKNRHSGSQRPALLGRA
jgi:hypothetical protein